MANTNTATTTATASTKKNDLTQGSISRNIFRFCIPLIVGSLVQVCFNMADTIVLGQMAGGVAMASVGACANVVGMIVNFFVGLSGGVTVVLAHSIGMKNDDRSRTIISTALLSSFLIGLCAAGLAMPLGAPLLRLTECPAECFDASLTYTLIYYAGIPAITVYNFGAAVLRATGDSRRPTLYMVTAGALNVVLNVVLCLLMENKVAAVALATVASQLLGAVLTLRRIFMMKESYKPDFKHPRLSGRIFGKILRYGIPNAFCSCMFAIANLQVQAGINSYGTDAIAGHTAACSIESLVSAFTSSFGTTTATMVGQNLGANRSDRVKRTIALDLLYSITISSVLCVIVFLFRKPLVHLYVPDSPGALPYAEMRMKAVLLWYAVNALNGILTSTLTAYGYSFFAMIGNFMTTIVFRTFWMQVIYPLYPAYRTIMTCYTVAWLLNSVLYSIAFTYVFTRYLHGKMRRI